MVQHDPVTGNTRKVKRAGPFEDPGDYEDYEYEIVVDRTSGKRLGVDANYGDLQTMQIDSIGEGLVKDWNECAFADTKVRVKDRIIEVNGIHGDINPMLRECKENKVLRLKFLREASA